jgi:fructose-bisphosphate aldolase class 1
MVMSSKANPTQATPEEIAQKTLKALKRTVPAPELPVVVWQVSSSMKTFRVFKTRKVCIL